MAIADLSQLPEVTEIPERDPAHIHPEIHAIARDAVFQSDSVLRALVRLAKDNADEDPDLRQSLAVRAAALNDVVVTALTDGFGRDAEGFMNRAHRTVYGLPRPDADEDGGN